MEEDDSKESKGTLRPMQIVCVSLNLKLILHLYHHSTTIQH